MRRLRDHFRPNVVFHSRWEKYSWWLGTLNRLFLFTTAVSFLTVFAFFSIAFESPGLHDTDHGSDSRVVNISKADIYQVEKRYDEELEKGFCVYGHTTEDFIVVEDVVHEDDPSVQKEDEISFTCFDETVERLPEMFLSDYSLIGNIHTHPEYARLSMVDVFSFGSLQLFQKTFGVYNGEDLEFFTPGSLSYSLDKNVENTISREQYARSPGVNT